MALKPLFFYGTLRHLPLLELALGRSVDQMDLSDARLPEHTVYWVQDQPFPMIASAPGQAAHGLLLRDPTREDIERLDYYEGGFAYDLKDVVTVDKCEREVTASVYFPKAGALAKGEFWSLKDWERDWSDISLTVAREAMDNFEDWSAQDLAVKLPMMRRRADAMRTAKQRNASVDDQLGAQNVQVLSNTRVHSHFFALDRMRLRHERYDGSLTPPLDREIVYAGHAVVILPYDPARDQVMLIEQFRVNMFALGDPKPWVIEAIAGLVDPGEAPEAAAVREAHEEAGVHLNQLVQVSAAYSSTGSTTEFLTSYVALADFGNLSEGGGLMTEGEDIRRIIMPFSTFAEGLQTHRFCDAPLVSLGFWLMLNRDRLRGSA